MILSNMRPVEVNNGRWAAISNFIDLKFFKMYPLLKPYNLFYSNQGLTQTFMSSGPQDHQLRGSGGPTIFLVVLTTTNVTALVNLESIVFTLAMCFHIQ